MQLMAGRPGPPVLAQTDRMTSCLRGAAEPFRILCLPSQLWAAAQMSAALRDDRATNKTKWDSALFAFRCTTGQYLTASGHSRSRVGASL